MRLQKDCFWKLSWEQSLSSSLFTYTESRFQTRLEGGCDSLCTLRQSWREHRYSESHAAALFSPHLLEKHRKQLPASTTCRLFVPMATSSRGEAACQGKTLRYLDGELPFSLTDTHRGTSVLSFFLSCPVSLFSQALSISLVLQRDTHKLTACLLSCLLKKHLVSLIPHQISTSWSFLLLITSPTIYRPGFQSTPDLLSNKWNKSARLSRIPLLVS